MHCDGQSRLAESTLMPHGGGGGNVLRQQDDVYLGTNTPASGARKGLSLIDVPSLGFGLDSVTGLERRAVAQPDLEMDHHC